MERIMCRPVIVVLLVTLSLSAGLAAAEEPPPKAILADLPFLAVDEVNRVYVDLAPEGSSRPFAMMLGTGATHSVLTPRAAKALGVRIAASSGTRTGAKQYWAVTFCSISTPDRAIQRPRPAGSTAFWGGTFSPNMSWSWISRRGVCVSSTQTASRCPRPWTIQRRTVLPLDVVGNRPGVTIEINGKPMKFLLDTGAPWSILLSGKFAGLGGVVSRKVPGFGLAGVMGDTETELGEAQRIALGPFAFDRVPVAVAPKGWFNQGFPDDSVIGYDVLAQFLVRIDYARERLWLRRRPDARVTLFGIDYTYPETGALFLPHRGGYQVLLVREGSTAQARGLEPGQILSEAALPPRKTPHPTAPGGSSNSRHTWLSRDRALRITAARLAMTASHTAGTKTGLRGAYTPPRADGLPPFRLGWHLE